jgi:hypothetical protein
MANFVCVYSRDLLVEREKSSFRLRRFERVEQLVPPLRLRINSAIQGHGDWCEARCDMGGRRKQVEILPSAPSISWAITLLLTPQ